MKATKNTLEILEEKLAQHNTEQPTSILGQIHWKITKRMLESRYQVALEVNGYKSAEERNKGKQKKLKNKEMWDELFSNHPVEQLPFKDNSRGW